MAAIVPTLISSGSQSANVGSWHTLATITSAYILQSFVDVNALAAGEYVEIQVQTKTLSSGTTRVVMGGIFSWRNGGYDPIVVSDTIMSDQEYLLRIRQLNGTGRSFPFKILAP